MAKTLIVVESPAKARTIKKYIGPDYQVKASMGHVKDLPKRELGVDIENSFRPTYQVIQGRAKQLTEIRKAANSAEAVYLAPDPDREGEAIAWHIAEEIRAGNKPVHRILFNEITKKAVREALESPRPLDRNKFEAQQARRVLDRLVGYQISPILWDKVRKGLSAGRVQSVAVRMICEREKEIRAFRKKEYWSIVAGLEGKNPPPFDAKLVESGSGKIELGSEAETQQVLDSLEGAPYRVRHIEKKLKKRNPAPPFITSRLQQEASRKLRFSPQKTMKVAQSLYEGVELGESEMVGLITYMRTDSPRISDDALKEVRDHIRDQFGGDYLPEKPVRYKSKKSAQDAHEAIRPTSLQNTPEKIARFLGRDEQRLYSLIWKRFVASQMVPARFDQQIVDIEAASPKSGEAFLFRASGTVLRFKGFMAVYIEGSDEEKTAVEGEREGPLPPMIQGEELALLGLTPNQHFTKPPPRYNESTLIRALEENGIGRPSTYASILSTIRQKDYVLLQERKFVPMELGFIVTNLLVESFPDVLNVEFTAGMEELLDQIEEGRMGWIETLTKFYTPFKADLDRARTEMRNVKRQGTPTDITCEKCKAPMVIRIGSSGEFLACSAYPDCRSTKEFSRDEQGKIVVEEAPETDQTCEKCGKPMVPKRGRFGLFLACSGYPECKATRPIDAKPGESSRDSGQPSGETCPSCGGQLLIKRARTGNRFLACEKYPACKHAASYKIGVGCPTEGCGGDIVERSSKRGRLFYSCSRYPDCRFTSWRRPVPGECPQCSNPFLVEKQLKAGTVIGCPVKGCGYGRPPETEESSPGDD